MRILRIATIGWGGGDETWCFIVLWTLRYHILSSTILMSVTSIQYYRLFYSLFSPPLYPVPGCGELEVLPSIHADLYSDIMAVWICCCYVLVTDQLYTRNTCYVVRLCGRSSWGTSFTQLTGSFSLLCRAVAAFLYDVWLVGLFCLWLRLGFFVFTLSWMSLCSAVTAMYCW